MASITGRSRDINLPAQTALRTLAVTINARWICEQAYHVAHGCVCGTSTLPYLKGGA
jgi:hypothetical protein